MIFFSLFSCAAEANVIPVLSCAFHPSFHPGTLPVVSVFISHLSPAPPSVSIFVSPRGHQLLFHLDDIAATSPLPFMSLTPPDSKQYHSTSAGNIDSTTSLLYPFRHVLLGVRTLRHCLKNLFRFTVTLPLPSSPFITITFLSKVPSDSIYIALCSFIFCFLFRPL